MGLESNLVLIFAEWDWSLPELPVDSWWFFTVILVLLVLSIWLVARLTTHTTDDIDPTEIDRQMLSAVSELRSQGELTQEEFRSIKSRLVDRLAPNQDAKQPDSHPEHSQENEPVQPDSRTTPVVDSAKDIQGPASEASFPEHADEETND